MAMDWREYIILYEDNEGLVRLQELLKYPSQAKDMKVTIRQLVPGPGNDYRWWYTFLWGFLLQNKEFRPVKKFSLLHRVDTS